MITANARTGLGFRAKATVGVAVEVDTIEDCSQGQICYPDYEEFCYAD